MRRLFMILALLSVACLGAAVQAAETEPQMRESSTGRLITAENGVAPGTASINAGLRIDMAPGWKTYWRSPGEVGLPPEIDWEGSTNLASAELLYPAPERFTAFDIENFGYGGTVIFPLAIRLDTPGAPAQLRATARLLVCAEICIPEDFSFALDLPAGGGIDADNAARLASAIARVPQSAEETATELSAHVDDSRLVVEARRAVPFRAPDVFPELGAASFGKPDIRLGEDGRRLWAAFPIHYLPADAPAMSITLTDGDWATTGEAERLAAPPSAPVGAGLFWTIGIALLGGLILNIMPCVLPVLSIKLGHAIERSGQGKARIRAGFLAAAAGIVSFMWVLAAIVLVLQASGTAVGWGVQFQSPVFLSLMILLMAGFAANMAGLFEINLPEPVQRRMGGPQGAGLAGDYATGAFAAVMATPCSAPFLGTAVAFALAGGTLDTLAIFTALGIGLALPYLGVAVFPRLVTALPRPGPWMVRVKWALAAALGLTALWLLSVLLSAAGPRAALAMAVISAGLVAVLALRKLPRRGALVAALALAGLGLPAALVSAPEASAETRWAAFSTDRIATEVAAGNIVFVDVTADWCLTCMANKALVLDRAPVSELLADETIVPMQADWTRPDPAIQAYLESFGRFGIPFNAVYGPSAPNGVPLPELLSTASVQEAIAAAR